MRRTLLCFPLIIAHGLRRDLDFEYPVNSAQGQGFADLVTELRIAFTELQSKKGDTVPYQITAAVSAGPANYQFLVVSQMNTAMSYWNLMVRFTFWLVPEVLRIPNLSGIRLRWLVAHIRRQPSQFIWRYSNWGKH